MKEFQKSVQVLTVQFRDSHIVIIYATAPLRTESGANHCSSSLTHRTVHALVWWLTPQKQNKHPKLILTNIEVRKIER